MTLAARGRSAGPEKETEGAGACGKCNGAVRSRGPPEVQLSSRAYTCPAMDTAYASWPVTISTFLFALQGHSQRGARHRRHGAVRARRAVFGADPARRRLCALSLPQQLRGKRHWLCTHVHWPCRPAILGPCVLQPASMAGGPRQFRRGCQAASMALHGC